MSKEIDEELLEESLEWAEDLRDYITRVKQGKADLLPSVDVGRYIRGHVLDSITADDRNALIFSERRFSPLEGEISKLQILERLDFESSLEELPEDIKKRLDSVKRVFEQSDCSNYDYYRRAAESWEQMSDWVQTKINSTSELDEDISYSTRVDLKDLV